MRLFQLPGSSQAALRQHLGSCGRVRSKDNSNPEFTQDGGIACDLQGATSAEA